MVTKKQIKDYHKMLGVDENATRKEKQIAFFKKAKELHPDRNKAPDAKEKFVLLVEIHWSYSGNDNATKLKDKLDKGITLEDPIKKWEKAENDFRSDNLWLIERIWTKISGNSPKISDSKSVVSFGEDCNELVFEILRVIKKDCLNKKRFIIDEKAIKKFIGCIDRSSGISENDINNLLKFKYLQSDVYNNKLKNSWEKYLKTIEPILLSCTRKINYYSKKFYLKYCKNLSLEMDDLKQEGRAALYRAIPRFDYSRGNTFEVYAADWIKEGIWNAIYNERKGIFGMSVPKLKKIDKINKNIECLTKEYGDEPTDEQIADYLDKDLYKFYQEMKMMPIPSKEINLDYEDRIEDRIGAAETLAQIDKFLKLECTQEERKLFKLLYCKKKSKTEIAKIFGKSPPSINYREGKLREKLKKLKKLK